MLKKKVIEGEGTVEGKGNVTSSSQNQEGGIVTSLHRRAPGPAPRVP